MLEDRAFVDWVRKQPSKISGVLKDIVAAHMVSKGARGDDYRRVSVTDGEHKFQHQKGIESFEKKYGVDRKELVYETLVGYIQHLYELIVHQKQKYENAVRQHRKMFEDTRGHDMYKYQIELNGETFESPSFEAVMKRAKQTAEDSVVTVTVLTNKNKEGEWLPKQDLEVQIRAIKIEERVAV